MGAVWRHPSPPRTARPAFGRHQLHDPPKVLRRQRRLEVDLDEKRIDAVRRLDALLPALLVQVQRPPLVDRLDVERAERVDAIVRNDDKPRAGRIG